jgi:hypothetical protein
MIKVLAVVALLAVAQVFPSCGGHQSTSDDQSGPSVSKPPQVIGWIDEKRHRAWEFDPYIIVINSHEYGVPQTFWMSVGVGDLVKYDGDIWKIVEKKR